MRLVAALLILAAAAAAQELPFDRGTIGMMPGIDAVRGKVYAAFGRCQPRHARANQKIVAADAKLRNRSLPGAERVKAQQARLAAIAERAQALRDLEKGARDAGLTADQLARLKSIPRGALREERYNHGVLLEAPGLNERQRAVLRRLVTATDAAQLTVTEQQTLLVRGLDAKADRVLRQRLTNACQQQVRAIEQRFWRMAYYVLTPEQMRATREIRSPRYQYTPEIERQLYTVPGLEATQASRLRSVFREYESEAAADQAAIRNAQVKQRNPKLTKQERQALQKQIGDGYRRITALRTAQRDAIREILTEKQLEAFRSLPPQLNLGVRGRGPWEITRDMRLSDDQRGRLSLLFAAARKALQDIERERREKAGEMAGAGLGPESPQKMTMDMMAYGARGATMASQRATGQVIFVDICNPEQVASWVVAPSVKP